MKNNIKYLAMDVDGTLTDGKIYMGEQGELMKAFSIKDGCGIHDILIPSGAEPIIITGRQSTILELRCKELGIEKLYQGIRDKVAKLIEAVGGEESLKHTAYIGDDINDLKAMKLVKEHGGMVGAPADAAKEVIAIADFTAVKNGGDGAVREFIEWLMED